MLFKASITVSLALIIEASLEAYFQFWLQSNYSLPDVFITITSIVKIRFNMILWSNI